MGFLREAVRAWLGTSDERISDGREPDNRQYPVSYGGTKFEVRKIANGYLVITARWDGDIADMIYVEKAEDIGPTITAKLVEYTLRGEAEAKAKSAYLGQAGNTPAAANYHAAKVLGKV